jgi:tellurite methyltransferase
MHLDFLDKLSIVDVRSSREFAEGHISASANFPAQEIIQRMHELPSKAIPLSLFGRLSEIKIAKTQLKSKGYQIEKQLESSVVFLKQLENAQRLISGSQSKRFWQPSKVVELFTQNYAHLSSNHFALDIACGAGRDSVYLASNGWKVTSIDYSGTALEKLAELAKRNNHDVSSRLIDLEKELNLSKSLDDGAVSRSAFGAVVVVRYLHRPLLKQLKDLIDQQGFIVYQTFMKGCEKFGSPKNPRFLLEEGELAKYFSDFDIKLDRIEFLPDGRPTNLFIAQKVN